jgi:hypothetical protein
VYQGLAQEPRPEVRRRRLRFPAKAWMVRAIRVIARQSSASLWCTRPWYPSRSEMSSSGGLNNGWSGSAGGLTGATGSPSGEPPLTPGSAGSDGLLLSSDSTLISVHRGMDGDACAAGHDAEHCGG